VIKCDAAPSKRQRPVASKVKQRVLPPRRPGQPPREIPTLEERLAKEQDQLSWLFWPVAIATSFVISRYVNLTARSILAKSRDACCVAVGTSARDLRHDVAVVLRRQLQGL
jgi:hypothetical protein